MSSFDYKYRLTPGAIKEAVLSTFQSDISDSSPKNSSESLSPTSSQNETIVFREKCQYCIISRSILGVLTLTRESLTFEPDIRDVNVDEHGQGYYQIHVDMENILECGCIGGPSQELLGLEDMRCNGFLQVVLRQFSDSFDLLYQSSGSSFESAYQEPIQERSKKSMGFNFSKIGSAIFSVLPGTKGRNSKFFKRSHSHVSILFGFFNKELAYMCTNKLMALLDMCNNSTPSSDRSRIIRIPFSSNSLIESWNNLTDTAEELDEPNDKYVNFEHFSAVGNRSKILTFDMVKNINSYLPASIAIREWILSFETVHDGVSYHTFYKNLENKDNCIIVIEDSKGGVFGAFTPQIRYNLRFYGSGETFVFKFQKGNLKVFKSQGKNRCFIYSSDHSVIIGGGNNPAITIGRAFKVGTTAHSETFDNEPLSEDYHFEIKHMEVWTFGGFLTS
uniref:Oxidation resistance protein 1 n=1 Tax=Theileria annulata TaxID=5874 RepID=A0A3B0MM85_THEAN